MTDRIRDSLSSDSASAAIDKAKRKFTPPELREWNLLSRKTSRMWRNFWVKVLQQHGYSNVDIAKLFELSEATVRRIVKGE